MKAVFFKFSSQVKVIPFYYRMEKLTKLKPVSKFERFKNVLLHILTSLKRKIKIIVTRNKIIQRHKNLV